MHHDASGRRFKWTFFTDGAVLQMVLEAVTQPTRVLAVRRARVTDAPLLFRSAGQDRERRFSGEIARSAQIQPGFNPLDNACVDVARLNSNFKEIEQVAGAQQQSPIRSSCGGNLITQIRRVPAARRIEVELPRYCVFEIAVFGER